MFTSSMVSQGIYEPAWLEIWLLILQSNMQSLASEPRSQFHLCCCCRYSYPVYHSIRKYCAKSRRVIWYYLCLTGKYLFIIATSGRIQDPNLAGIMKIVIINRTFSLAMIFEMLLYPLIVSEKWCLRHARAKCFTAIDFKYCCKKCS